MSPHGGDAVRLVPTFALDRFESQLVVVLEQRLVSCRLELILVFAIACLEKQILVFEGDHILLSCRFKIIMMTVSR